MRFQTLWGSSSQNRKSEISKNARSKFLELRFAEQNVENIKAFIFRNSGTPVRRAKRRKPQTLLFQEFCDSCAQNKTSEISINALSGIMGVLYAEHGAENLNNCPFRNSGTPVRRTRRRKSQKMDFQEFWDSCAQNNTSEISNK